MLIERTNKEVIIRLPASMDTEEIQDVIDYLRYKELTSGFSIPQSKVDKLASQINKGWWRKNREKFIK